MDAGAAARNRPAPSLVWSTGETSELGKKYPQAWMRERKQAPTLRTVQQTDRVIKRFPFSIHLQPRSQEWQQNYINGLSLLGRR